jgi:hypothetical protein
MRHKLGSAAAVVALAAVGLAPSAASAAHCQNVEGTSPGYSYFGTDHVQEATHAEGGNPGPHAGTSGASNCRATTGSPSERAPGQN